MADASLMLKPSGADKSVTNLHFPGWYFLVGIFGDYPNSVDMNVR